MIRQKSYTGKGTSRHRWEDTTKLGLKEGGCKCVESPDPRSVAGPLVTIKYMEFADYWSSYFFITSSQTTIQRKKLELQRDFLNFYGRIDYMQKVLTSETMLISGGCSLARSESF
jgi:hypothetical protein